MKILVTFFALVLSAGIASAQRGTTVTPTGRSSSESSGSSGRGSSYSGSSGSSYDSGSNSRGSSNSGSYSSGSTYSSGSGSSNYNSGSSGSSSGSSDTRGSSTYIYRSETIETKEPETTTPTITRTRTETQATDRGGNSNHPDRNSSGNTNGQNGTTVIPGNFGPGSTRSTYYDYYSSGYGSTYNYGSNNYGYTRETYQEDKTPVIACATCYPNLYARPENKYRVHFSGKLLSDVYMNSVSSVIFEDDDAGEILGIGRYPSIGAAVKKAVDNTFDGIAIDERTRLIIYSQKNFQGEILLDMQGPAVINNRRWISNDAEYGTPNTKIYSSTLQQLFPAEKRSWSQTDMHPWSNGSMEIIEM